MDAETARKYLPFIGGAGAILVALALLFVLPDRGPATQVAVIHTDALRVDGNHIVYATGNIQFDKLTDWEIVATSSVSLPRDMSGLQFALQKRGTACVFAYVLLRDRSMYKQTSFATRVFSGPEQKNQFDSSWYIHTDDIPDGFEFQWEGKQPFAGEVRIIPQSFVGRWNYEDSAVSGFVLYDSEGAVVADECDADVDRMLESLVEWYEPATLTSSSRGELYIKDQRLLFIGADNVARIVYEPIGYMHTPVVHKNIIYTTEGAAINAFDPFTGASLLRAPALAVGEVINALYARDESFFLLAGAQCSEGGQDCPNRLLEYHIPTDRTIFLGNAVANFILGFSETENALYITQSFGDAGCFDAQVSRYSVRGGTVETVGGYGGCEGDDGVAVSRAAYTALLAQIGNDSSQVSHVLVENGTLRYPSDAESADRGAWPMIFAQ